MLWSAVLGIALSVCCGSPNTAPPSAARQATTGGVRLEMIADDLPALPPGLATAARPAGVVKLAYEFAARHPEVLQYVPCFCGCERGGHQGNHDCFVAARDPAGRVTAWEEHGMNCEICIDVARDAMQLHNSGATVLAIRNEIERRYASPNLGHTPTPMPPGADQPGA